MLTVNTSGEVGKLTATYAGPELERELENITYTLGNIPHAKLSLSKARTKQTTRMLKLECFDCGFVARTTAKHLENFREVKHNSERVLVYAGGVCPVCVGVVEYNV